MFGPIPVAGEIFSVEVRAGRVRLARGRISPTLLAAFADVVGRFPSERGYVRAAHDGSRARLSVVSLPSDLEQRLRNVFGPHATGLASAATVHAKSRGAGGGALAVAVFGLLLMLALSAVYVSGLVGHEPVADASEEEVRRLARQLMIESPEIVPESRVGPFRLYIDRLRGSGVLPAERGPEDAMYLAFGPRLALMMGPRIVSFDLEGAEPYFASSAAREPHEQLRTLGFDGARVVCDANDGCTLTFAGSTTTFVTPEDMRRSHPLPECVAAAIAQRLGAALERVAASASNHRRLVLVSATQGFDEAPFFGPGDGGTLIFAFLTRAEIDTLAQWQAAYDEAPVQPFGFEPPFGAHVVPRCRLDASTPRTGASLSRPRPVAREAARRRDRRAARSRGSPGWDSTISYFAFGAICEVSHRFVAPSRRASGQRGDPMGVHAD